MSEIDELIANVANEMKNSCECQENACEITFKHYQAREDIDLGTGSPKLRMIAWDRS